MHRTQEPKLTICGGGCKDLAVAMVNREVRSADIMAQKITTLFIDDIDGGAATGTVRFALDGTEYEIDLNDRHSEELRSALGRYITHARRVGGSARRGGRQASGTRLTKKQNTEIREWARRNGRLINDRGRVPADIVADFNAATGKSYGN